MWLHSKGMRRVYEDAGVLRSDNRFNNGGEIVYVGQGFDAQQDVVESSFS